MIGKRLSTYKASRILELYAFNGLNKTQISKALNISRGTVIKYICYYKNKQKQRHPLINKAINMNSPQTCSFISDDYGYKDTDNSAVRLFELRSCE